MDNDGKIRSLFNQFVELHFKKPVEAGSKDLRSALLFSMFLEWFGLDNPLGIYILDFYPELLSEFHLWHKSLGLEHYSLSFLPCC
ncbi:cory-CC-star protein [Thermocrinis sp.]